MVFLMGPYVTALRRAASLVQPGNQSIKLFRGIRRKP
jgi:hypothetical protein